MKIPENRWLRFMSFLLSQLLLFFIATSNIRAASNGLYLWTALTDMAMLAQGALITKVMIEDKKSRDWYTISGLSIGGAFGSMLSIYITKHIW